MDPEAVAGARIGRLAALLGELGRDRTGTGAGAGPPATPREIAEFIWLARQLPRDGGGPAAGDEVSALPRSAAGRLPAPGADDPAAAPADVPPEQPDARSRLHLPHQQTPGDADAAGVIRARPVRLSGPVVLPERRAVARALRPLKRRVPDIRRTVFDEDATAAYVADHRRWLPVLRPAVDRWLSVALVLDTYSEGAVFWEPLARELRALLQQLGAFRDVQLHHLGARPDGRPGLGAGTRTPPHLLRPAGSLADPAHRTLTLLLTDGVAPEWQGAALRSVLWGWADRGPTAILQTLPEHAWGRTALAPTAVRFRSPEAGSPNSRFTYTSYGLGVPAPAPRDIPVPTVAVSPDWLGPWARLVSGATAMDGAAVVLGAPGADRGAPDTGPDPARPVTFEDFRAAVQPAVFKLAAYLSAAPLNLPVMRAVQTALLPASPPSDLAEIIFSGLLERVRVPSPDGHDAPHSAYEFVPGMRNRLLSTLRRDEAEEVIASVSSYVERHAAATGSRFTAAVTDPEGAQFLPASAAHWAEIQRVVRRRQGRTALPAAPQAPAPAPAVPAPAVRVAPEPAPEPLPAAAEGRRFLIALSTGPGLGKPVVEPASVYGCANQVRSLFAALEYRIVDIRVVTADSTGDAVLQSIARWAVTVEFDSADVLVFYYAGRVAFGDRRTYLLMPSDKVPAPSEANLAVDQVRAMLIEHGLRNFMYLVDGLTVPPKRDQAQIPLEDEPAAELLSEHVVIVSKTREQWRTEVPTMASALGEVLAGTRNGTDATSPDTQKVLLDATSRVRGWPLGLFTRSTVAEGHRPASFFARPVGSPPSRDRAPGVAFAHRTALIDSLSDWLFGASDDHRTRVVQGSARSGKAGVVLRLAMNIRGTPPVYPTSLLMYHGARASTFEGFCASLAEDLGVRGREPHDILGALGRRGVPLPIVLDALDESRDSDHKAVDLLRRLADHPMARVVVAARQTHVPFLGDRDVLIDLDAIPKDSVADLDNSLDNGLNDEMRITRIRSFSKLEAAIGARRAQAATDHDTYGPHLAGMLVDLANRLSARGNPEGGLAAANEAIALYMTLSAPDPAAFAPHTRYAEATAAKCLQALPSSAPAARNPYHQVGRVIADDTFIGREETLHEIESLWRSPVRLANLAVIGHHRTGKTSLVRRALRTLPRTRPDLVQVWIDLGGHESRTTVFRSLANSALAEVRRRGADAPDGLVEVLQPLNEAVRRAGTWSELHDTVRDFFAAMHAAGQYGLVVLDEFDAAASVFQGAAEFVLLRALVSDVDSALGLITISRRQTEEIETRTAGGSLLSGVIATRLYPGLFGEADIDLMLARAASAGIDLTRIQPDIERCAGGHPYLLDVLCHALVERHRATGTLDFPGAYERVAATFTAEFERLRLDILSDSPDNAAMLSRLAAGLVSTSSANPADRSRLRRMLWTGIALADDADRYHLFSAEFARYVAEFDPAL